MTVRIIHKDCDPEIANDRSLPYTAYLVEYYDDGQHTYDIVIANRKVDIFDHYWDKYREDLIRFKQTEGRVNPKLWGANTSKKKK